MDRAGGAAARGGKWRGRRWLLGPLLAALVACALCGSGGLLCRVCYLAAVWAPVAARAAVQGFARSSGPVVAALEASGPVFIKLAQWLSTRRDLLPEELCEGMSRLHEQVSGSPLKPWQRRRIADAVPGLRVGGLLGAGCVAQVYAGELKERSGGGAAPTDVVIKVLRPEVPQLLRTDMQLLRLGARAAEWLRPELRWLALRSAVDTFGEYLRQQTDFTVEGANLRRLGANFLDGDVEGGVMRVPRVVADAADLLVTTRARGKSLTEFIKETKGKEDTERARERVFTSVTDAMARMILKHKFIHGDLHPGNLFVHMADSSSKPEITLIDAGISIEISDDMASMMSGAVLAVWNRQGRKLGQAIVRFHNNSNLTNHAVDLDELEVKIGNLILAGSILCREAKDRSIWSEMFDTYREYRESRVSEYFALLAGRLSRHKVRVSPALWSVMTAFALIEGSMYELGHGVDVLHCAKPYVIPGFGALKKVRSKVGSLLPLQ